METTRRAMGWKYVCKQRTERNTKDQERIISREEIDNRDADWEIKLEEEMGGVKG